MSLWPSTRAKRVLSALRRIGWDIKRQSGSHRTLSRPGWPDFVFAFHDGDEVGPRMLARIAQANRSDPRRLVASLGVDQGACGLGASANNAVAGFVRCAHFDEHGSLFASLVGNR